MAAQTIIKCPYCGSHEIEVGHFMSASGHFKYRCKKCSRVFSDEDLETLRNTDYDEELKKRYDPSKWR